MRLTRDLFTQNWFYFFFSTHRNPDRSAMLISG